MLSFTAWRRASVIFVYPATDPSPVWPSVSAVRRASPSCSCTSVPSVCRRRWGWRSLIPSGREISVQMYRAPRAVRRFAYIARASVLAPGWNAMKSAGEGVGTPGEVAVDGIAGAGGHRDDTFLVALADHGAVASRHSLSPQYQRECAAQ